MVDIKGYEGKYAITENGDVWSYKRRLYLKPFDNGHGYLYVVLNANGKKKHKRVNRLVAEAFLDNPDNLSDVGHWDDDRRNNNIFNLYWTSRKDNVNTEQCRRKQTVKIFSSIRCVETGEVFSS